MKIFLPLMFTLGTAATGLSSNKIQLKFDCGDFGSFNINESSALVVLEGKTNIGDKRLSYQGTVKTELYRELLTAFRIDILSRTIVGNINDSGENLQYSVQYWWNDDPNSKVDLSCTVEKN